MAALLTAENSFFMSTFILCCSVLIQIRTLNNVFSVIGTEPGPGRTWEFLRLLPIALTGFYFLWRPSQSGGREHRTLSTTCSGLLISLTQETGIIGLYRSHYNPLSDKLDYILTNMGSR